MYEYRIKEIVKVIDGDTVDVIIDLGFHTFVKKRIRLYGIDTPETRTRDKAEKIKGLEAKKKLCDLCDATVNNTEAPLILKSYGVGKYGRVLGELISAQVNFNKVLVAEGYAEEYYGK
jgi:endonuclease YncB( thermonuclease family)|tara:strand:- start:15127 stop:15480 length:354 start_codon:yes stop_codon:yes gene_type:complete